MAQAIVQGGGGSSRTDCLTVIDAAVNYPPDNPKRFRCADGDPCDADGVVNGVCQFDVTICSNSSYNPTRCTLVGVDSITVDHAIDNGDRKFDPDFQALQNRINNGIVGPSDPPNTDPDVCALPSTFLVPVIGPLERQRLQARQEAGEDHVAQRAGARPHLEGQGQAEDGVRSGAVGLRSHGDLHRHVRSHPAADLQPVVRR
jgi:hypothetical protein